MSQMISGGVCAAQGFRAAGLHVGVKTHRSEEHTSELQSLA